jgi:hypothetical protein
MPQEPNSLAGMEHAPSEESRLSHQDMDGSRQPISISDKMSSYGAVRTQTFHHASNTLLLAITCRKGEVKQTVWLNWEAQNFLSNEGIPSYSDVWEALVLVGSANGTLATTYGNYLSRTWPSLEEAFRTLFKRLDIGWDWDNPLMFSSISADQLSIKKLSGDESSLLLLISGPGQMVALAIEICCWLTASLRTSDRPGLAESNSCISVFHGAMVNQYNIDLEIRPTPLTALEAVATSCWFPLFPCTVVARDFYIPPRKDGQEGLEIEFGMMTSLCGIEYTAIEDDGIVLKGYLATLYPVEMGNDYVQWHLRARTRAGSSAIGLSSLQPQRTQTRSRVLVTCLEEVTKPHLRHFLGLWTEPQITLGTTLQDPAAMACSNAREKRWIWQKDSRTGALGFGWHGATLGGNQTWKISSKRSSPFLDRNKGNDVPFFEKKLLEVKNRPICLYCASEKRAWLVSTLSVIFQIAHAGAHWDMTMDPTLEYNIPFCPPSPDGGNAAYTVIRAAKNEQILTGQEVTLQQFINYYWGALDFDEVSKTSSSETSISGYEFMDIVRIAQPFRWKEVSLSLFHKGWLPLLNHGLVKVLFIEGMSDIIIPTEETQARICQWWSRIPRGLNLLTASLPCLKWLAERYGSESMERLTENHFWHMPNYMFWHCTHNRMEMCDRLQVLRRFREALPPDPGRLEKYPESAVIFKYVDDLEDISAGRSAANGWHGPIPTRIKRR